MVEQTPTKLSREEVLKNIDWHINTLESKIRVNEQNLFNLRKHMQMINHNLLDFKTEMREKLDNLLRQNTDLTTATDKLSLIIDKMAGKKKSKAKAVAKPAAPEKKMSEQEASKVLDDILKGGKK